MVVEVEIDETNDIVKEYENTDELLSDIVSYRFSSVLPVMAAVKTDFEETTFQVLEHGICLV